MNFQKTFDMEKGKTGRLADFFTSRGYKMELSRPDYYRFKRGSIWFAPFSPNVTNLPTLVDVILSEKDSDTVQVHVIYEIDTMGKIIPRSHQDAIKAELDSL